MCRNTNAQFPAQCHMISLKIVGPISEFVLPEQKLF